MLKDHGDAIEEAFEEAFEASVPERPRILSSSSESSLESFSLPKLSTHFDRLTVQGSANNEAIANSVEVQDAIVTDGAFGASEAPLKSSSPTFFAFGESDEHQTIMNYVQQMVVQETFDHSTDSETD